jgi:hypothetical protein
MHALHSLGQAVADSFHDEVIMVRDQAVGVEGPVQAPRRVGQQDEEPAPVVVLAIDGDPPGPARCRVVLSAHVVAV